MCNQTSAHLCQLCITKAKLAQTNLYAQKCSQANQQVRICPFAHANLCTQALILQEVKIFLFTFQLSELASQHE